MLKGADFERRLVKATADGIAVQPLYGPWDGTAGEASGLPGAAPFTRGSAAAGAAVGGWDVRQLHAHPDPATANAQILEDLERGVTSITLRVDRALAQGGTQPDGLLAYDVQAFEQALDGVLLDLAPVALDAGARGVAAARLLLALVERRGHAAGEVKLELNLDPTGAAAAGEPVDPAGGLAEAAALAAELAGTGARGTAFLADGRPYHAGGATEAQEIACIVATGIEQLRALTALGLAPEAAARQVALSAAVDADFFLSLAKLRALRRLWARVLEVTGATAAMPALRLQAETATRMLTRRDPYVNLLRGTVATFAAVAGGATSVTVLPFDHALGLPAGFARRLARNTQLVLMEESSLGRVIDPAGGSWYVEHLTEELAAKAWAIVQRIEAEGGMVAALRAGLPQNLIATSWAAREKALASRREPVTGVSEFPDLAETQHQPAAPSFTVPKGVTRLAAPAEPVAPVTAHRLAEAFEALRDRSDAVLAQAGDRPRVFLCNLGQLAEFGARATFAKNLFEAGGFATVPSEPLTTPEAAAAAFAASGARLAAICSSDENYASMAEGAARALKGAASARVYLMGRPEDERRAGFAAAGIDEFVHVGIDVLATLQRAQALAADGEAA
ncbi:MAG: methylmalonyl-CoA mutase family protein [Geminicoccaceae bacterium]